MPLTTENLTRLFASYYYQHIRSTTSESTRATRRATDTSKLYPIEELEKLINLDLERELNERYDDLRLDVNTINDIRPRDTHPILNPNMTSKIKFVLKTDGSLVFSLEGDGMIPHIAMANPEHPEDARCLSAGTLIFEEITNPADGSERLVLRHIDNRSGGFHPPFASLSKVIKQLLDYIPDDDGIVFDYYEGAGLDNDKKTFINKTDLLNTLPREREREFTTIPRVNTDMHATPPRATTPRITVGGGAGAPVTPMRTMDSSSAATVPLTPVRTMERMDSADIPSTPRFTVDGGAGAPVTPMRAMDSSTGTAAAPSTPRRTCHSSGSTPPRRAIRRPRTIYDDLINIHPIRRIPAYDRGLNACLPSRDMSPDRTVRRRPVYESSTTLVALPTTRQDVIAESIHTIHTAENNSDVFLRNIKAISVIFKAVTTNRHEMTSEFINNYNNYINQALEGEYNNLIYVARLNSYFAEKEYLKALDAYSTLGDTEKLTFISHIEKVKQNYENAYKAYQALKNYLEDEPNNHIIYEEENSSYIVTYNNLPLPKLELAKEINPIPSRP